MAIISGWPALPRSRADRHRPVFRVYKVKLVGRKLPKRCRKIPAVLHVDQDISLGPQPIRTWFHVTWFRGTNGAHANRLVRSKHDVPGAASRLPFSHDRADLHIAARLRANEQIFKLCEAKETKEKTYEYGYAKHLGTRRTPGSFWWDGW